MNEIYQKVRDGALGLRREPRGLFIVSGSEAKQFLDGLITNDVKTLEDGAEMKAAFPNAQGRLLAVVSVKNDAGRFVIETEGATRQKLYENLYRFTFAGDFVLEDLSDTYSSFEIFAKNDAFDEGSLPESSFVFERVYGKGVFVPNDAADNFASGLAGAVELDDTAFEILRIESGVPLYGKDMDETTVVPELGIDDLISYKKGCYIGQEIIARIHFRGHIAKRLSGLLLDTAAASPAELKTAEGKSAGNITSSVHSPALGRAIALGFVRYDHLEPGTKLFAGETECTVAELPFI